MKSPLQIFTSPAHRRQRSCQHNNANARIYPLGLFCLLASLLSLGLHVRKFSAYSRRANVDSPHWVGNQNESHPQQVVILAGPHKTASSSIQYNLMRWFEDQNDTLLLQKRWSFDPPIKTFQKQGCSRAWQYPYQVYYWMVQAMLRSKNTACSSNESTGEIIYEPEQMLELYTKRFNEGWSRGKSIVIATEAIDFANSIRYDGTPNEFLLRFLELLPFTSAENNITEKVTAVIMYISPRIEHLQSMWHQHQKARRNKNVSFSQYLESISSNLDMLNYLVSFNLGKTVSSCGDESCLD